MKFLGKKRMYRTTALLVLILIIGAFSLKGIHYFVYGNELPVEAVVKQVLDGDTVLLKGGEKVRYLGINAPEARVRKGAQGMLKPQILGREAMTRNKQLVEGKKIQLEYDRKKRDTYGRLLAYVRTGGVFVNGELVKEGWGFMDGR